mgnify:CR=1 FL=1
MRTFLNRTPLDARHTNWALETRKLGYDPALIGYTDQTPDPRTVAPDDPRLLTYVSDAIAGFMKDLERIGRADDVTLLVFSEFGRRAAENTSLGTDHGTANHMYVIGKQVRGGHYGEAPSLTDLDEGGNLKYTTDFRRVYASLIEGWLRHDSKTLLSGDFKTFPIFG